MTNQQKEQLRHAALEYLAGQSTRTFSPTALKRMIMLKDLVDFAFVEEDLMEALAVLEGFKYVVAHRDPLGSSLHIQITAEGVLFHERNQ